MLVIGVLSRAAHREREFALTVGGVAPAAEGEVGIERAALAVAALGIHQHAVDQVRIALPLEPRPFGPAGEVR